MNFLEWHPFILLSSNAIWRGWLLVIIYAWFSTLDHKQLEKLYLAVLTGKAAFHMWCTDTCIAISEGSWSPVRPFWPAMLLWFICILSPSTFHLEVSWLGTYSGAFADIMLLEGRGKLKMIYSDSILSTFGILSFSSLTSPPLRVHKTAIGGDFCTGLLDSGTTVTCVLNPLTQCLEMGAVGGDK